jgi:hypothetical protein
MTAAANTPHTITNALMICFSSETDIASGSGVANDPGLAADRGRRSLRSGWGRNTCVSVLKATKLDRAIVLECNGRDCTNSMMRCGTADRSTVTNSPRGISLDQKMCRPHFMKMNGNSMGYFAI